MILILYIIDISDAPPTGYDITDGLLQGRQYKVAVAANLDGEPWTWASNVRYFSIRVFPDDGSGSTGAKLGKPIVTATDSPVTSTMGSVMIKWDQVANATTATKYVVNVSNTTTGINIVKDVKVSTISYPIDSGLLSTGHQYRITISAIDPERNGSL